MRSAKYLLCRTLILPQKHVVEHNFRPCRVKYLVMMENLQRIEFCKDLQVFL